MGEAQEVERLRLATPGPLPLRRRLAAELDQTGLVRMQDQRKLRQPIPQFRLEPLGIGLVLKAGNEVSGAGGSHPRALAEPYVTLSRHTAPIVRPRPKSRSQWANSPVWRRAMRSSQWMARVLCLRKDLNFRSAHRARKTSMCLRVGESADG